MVRWFLICFQTAKLVQIVIWSFDKMNKQSVLNVIRINVISLCLPIVYLIWQLESTKYNLYRYNKAVNNEVDSTHSLAVINLLA